MPLIRVAGTGTRMALRLGGLLYVLAIAPSGFDVVAVGFGGSRPDEVVVFSRMS